MADMTFNCNDAPAPENMEPFATEAPMQIIETEIDEKGTGTVQLKTVFEVLDGEHKGRKVIEWYTTKCATQQAVEIGQRQIRQICEAVGLTGFTRTEELHNKPLIGRTKIDGEYTRMKSVKPIGGAVAPATPPPVSAPPPDSIPTSGSKKPWEQ